MQRTLSLGISILLLMLSGCAPASSEPTEPVMIASQPPIEVDTETPSETLVVTEAPTSTDTPIVVVTTAPAMEVGSTFAHVDGSVLVAVPGGEFTMGGNGTDNAAHSVSLSDFWISSTKVTNQQYAVCVRLGICTPPDSRDNPTFAEIGHANHPVVGVTYEQAAEYCGFIHGRLPTEAEWEKSARGPDGNDYPWGNTDPSCDLANFSSCQGQTNSVVDYLESASYYGVYQMTGNVFEWVSDWYASDYYQNSGSENPSGPAEGTQRSVRSSGFASSLQDLLLATRHAEDPAVHRNDLGFRCVVEDPDYFAPFCEAPPIYGQTQQVDVSETCPRLDINQFPGCERKLAVTNVGFVGPSDAQINSGGCAPTGDPRVFACVGAGQVSMSASCQVDISGSASCPAGYSLEGSQCRADQSQGACLPGMESNAELGCCTVAATGNTAPATAICPVGTFHVAGQNTCTSTPVSGVVSVVESIQLKVCTGSSGGGGSGEPGACKPPTPDHCDSIAGAGWDSDLCCCAEAGVCYQE